MALAALFTLLPSSILRPCHSLSHPRFRGMNEFRGGALETPSNVQNTHERDLLSGLAHLLQQFELKGKGTASQNNTQACD